MSQSDSRKIVQSLLVAMKGLFQNSTRGARERAWNKFCTERGKAEVRKLINNPSLGLNHFDDFLTFKEWLNMSEATQQAFDPRGIKPVSWQMPNILEERGEITRQAQELRMDWRQLMNPIRQSRLTFLDDNTWANMHNTESTDPNLSLQQLLSWDHRDVSRILQAFQTGGSLPAPIVLVHENNIICLAGNTRLSVCKVLGVRPKVLMVRI